MLSLDAGTFTYFITVWDMLGNEDTFSVAVNTGNLGVNIFSYTLFPTVDFTQVGAIALGALANAASADASFASFGIIPEPSMLLIFGSGLLLLGANNLRRRNS